MSLALFTLRNADHGGVLKRFAVLTSGGDAAGMNAAIRAVVRTGLESGWEVYGVRFGYAGLVAGDFLRLGARDVGGIIQLGGTFLRSGRCLEFKTEAGRQQAIKNLQQNEIDALVVIGGDGSQTGAFLLSQADFPVVGIASTIDNDLYGSDITIGVDTALNIALESIEHDERPTCNVVSHEITVDQIESQQTAQCDRCPQAFLPPRYTRRLGVDWPP